MGLVTLIGHVTVVPGSILAGAYALRSVLRTVVAAVATFGHGEIARQAETVLRILVGKGKGGA